MAMGLGYPGVGEHHATVHRVSGVGVGSLGHQGQ